MKNEKQRDTQSREKGFMSGVLCLSASTLIVKIIGLAFKIPMLSYLGTEGMGYFNSAYEIYALLCVISTAGLPVALSMLVSAARTRGDGAGIKRIYRVARALFAFFGLGGSLLMLLLCRVLADAIGNPDAYLCIAAIAPALFFICMASAARGYCQGFEDMMPTAISQLIEALCKLALGVLFAVWGIKKGLPVSTVAALSVLGVTVGTLASALYLALQRSKRRLAVVQTEKKHSQRHKSILRELLAIALPITLGSALLGLTRIIDMTLIMRRLRSIGFSTLEANNVYGAYTTLAVPVFSLVPALITPVSMALVPQLSSFIEEKSLAGQRTVTENSMRLTVLFALPASLGIAAFSTPILELLFRGQSEAIAIASPLLAVLGVSVVFSCLITTTNAILQAQRRAGLPIISMLVGVIVKLVTSYLLIGNENIGALGAPIGSLACNLSVTALNLYFMSAHGGCSFDGVKEFFKPLPASILSVGGALAIYMLLLRRFDTVYLPFAIAVAFALSVYLILSALTGSITKDDVALLPFGGHILRLFKKFKHKGRNKNNDRGNNDGSTKEKNAS